MGIIIEVVASIFYLPLFFRARAKGQAHSLESVDKQIRRNSLKDPQIVCDTNHDK